MLTLSAKDLRREAANLAHGAGSVGAAASAGTIAGFCIGKMSRSKVLSAAVGAGGVVVAARSKERFVQAAGVGLAIGSLWSLFDNSIPPFPRF